MNQAERRPRASVIKRPQGPGELVRIAGLRQHRVASRAVGAPGILRERRVAGDREDRQRRRAGIALEAPGQFVAVDAGDVAGR